MLRALVLVFLRNLLDARHPDKVVDLLDLHEHQTEVLHLVVRELNILRVCLSHNLYWELLLQVLRISKQLSHFRNNAVILVFVSLRKVVKHFRRIAAD